MRCETELSGEQNNVSGGPGGKGTELWVFVQKTTDEVGTTPLWEEIFVNTRSI